MIFDAALLANRLPEGCALRVLTVAGSTNDTARELLDGGCAMGVVVALEQTGGRGQRGRSFLSGAGGLYMSLFSACSMRAELSQLITTAAGLSVYKALRRLGAEVSIKYPNDIYAEGRKLCGILTESRACGDRLTRFVTGIGINVNNSLEGIGDIAVSLGAMGFTANPALLAADIATDFFVYITALCGGDTALTDEYNRAELLTGCRTSDGAYIFDGKIDGFGRLIIS